mmetsp:Transcript_10234/g.22637  ORF Transcript_10234/g.22637 Transcript_10234/m.22637 type:complete len:321 (-) Transcript_10234:174-1136(-)|eukprot:CAMPEP_0206465794 /NCGR_PEP_ID=MMETSP0324_2-20121206/28051_1 /ASSEMBLY_ACC=CAM_ASM_000836 /TAXON_ID=2866 /ORGANISM="Crypthecodinium cohnii, Strain Seligo" /LENGTH=320 /DNA_ID=CAMNT_0053938739 /DNA_START=65 /DNA_END=1027 /DNA_ORIENTATION=-
MDYSKRDEFYLQLQLGIGTSLVHTMLTNPLDVARRSMQAAIVARKEPRTMREALSVARGLGVQNGLYRGLTASAIYTSVATPIWLFLYSWQKKKRDPVEAAVIARAVQVIVLHPIHFVKVCRQSGILLSPGASGHLERSVLDIRNSDGFWSMWRAMPATLGRDLVTAAVFWQSYRQASNFLKGDDEGALPATTLAGVACLSGIASTVLTQPADVVKTRMQAHQLMVSGEDGYRKVKVVRYFETLAATYKAAGLRGLWVGTVPRALRGGIGGLVLGPFLYYGQLIAEDCEKPLRKPYIVPRDPSSTIVHPRQHKALYIDFK